MWDNGSLFTLWFVLVASGPQNTTDFPIDPKAPRAVGIEIPLQVYNNEIV